MCRCDDVDKSISGNLPGKIAQPARTVHGCRDVAGPAVNNFHGHLYSIHHYGVGGLGLLPSEFPVNFHMLRQCCFTCPACKWRLFASVNQLHIVTGRANPPASLSQHIPVSPGSAYLNGAAVMAQVHRDFRQLASYDLIAQYPLGMSFGIQYGGNGWGGNGSTDTYTGMLTLRGWHDSSGGGYVSWQLASTSQGLKYRQGNGTVTGLANVGFSTTHTIYSTQNTTKASDGTLKAASPVARIVKSQEECQRTDIDEPGFVWCGCGTANAEAEGITLSRLDVGVYVLTGSAGLASEGWQLLPPMDPGGMGELGVVEAEQTENGGLTIRLFKRKYLLGDEGEIVKTKGKPMDVPVNSWIDVRLDMPDDSAFNQMMNQKLQP